MAFPTSVNNQITDELVQIVRSSAGIEEDRARGVVAAILDHLSRKEVLLREQANVQGEGLETGTTLGG